MGGRLWITFTETHQSSAKGVRYRSQPFFDGVGGAEKPEQTLSIAKSKSRQ